MPWQILQPIRCYADLMKQTEHPESHRADDVMYVRLFCYRVRTRRGKTSLLNSKILLYTPRGEHRRIAINSFQQENPRLKIRTELDRHAKVVKRPFSRRFMIMVLKEKPFCVCYEIWKSEFVIFLIRIIPFFHFSLYVFFILLPYFQVVLRYLCLPSVVVVQYLRRKG